MTDCEKLIPCDNSFGVVAQKITKNESATAARCAARSNAFEDGAAFAAPCAGSSLYPLFSSARALPLSSSELDCGPYLDIEILPIRTPVYCTILFAKE
jgi:hypothetical protein